MYDLKLVEHTKKENNVPFYGYVNQRDFSSCIQFQAVLLTSDSLFQGLIWFFQFFLAYLMLSESSQGFLLLGKMQPPEVANISKCHNERQD